MIKKYRIIPGKDSSVLIYSKDTWNKGVWNLYKYLDLFAGAGGLSEGFIQAGYTPVAHVEMDEAACYTLKTRSAYHWLHDNNKMDLYNDYISGKMSRREM